MGKGSYASWTAEERSAYMRPYAMARYEKKRLELINSLGGQCAHCGSMDKLEFDHIDPDTKLANVTDLITSGTWESVLAELAKCQLLCRICHIEKTRSELGPLARDIHGTPAAYKHCGPPKCSACATAWRDYCRNRRKLRKLSVASSQTDASVKHGTTHGYQFCGPTKCQQCKDAKNSAERARRARRKSEKIATLQDKKNST